jgi:hypothetical protein
VNLPAWQCATTPAVTCRHHHAGVNIEAAVSHRHVPGQVRRSYRLPHPVSTLCWLVLLSAAAAECCHM